VAEAYVYTDPACPWSWAAEPALRAMEAEFGDGLEVQLTTDPAWPGSEATVDAAVAVARYLLGDSALPAEA